MRPTDSSAGDLPFVNRDRSKPHNTQRNQNGSDHMEPDDASAETIQLAMNYEARAEVLRNGDFLNAVVIARRVGRRSADLARWKTEKSIFTIRERGRDYFPLFALNPDDNYRPYRAVGAILEIFGDSLSSWGLASWFIGLNSFLNDQAPKDLLASDPAWVIAAAKDEIEDIQHG